MRFSEIICPLSMQELLSTMNAHPGALLYAGGTSIMSGKSSRIVELPSFVISLHHVPELKQITKTDRYIEIGSMVTLGEILALKESTIPDVVRKALSSLGHFCTRALATIGGTILRTDGFPDLFPALACLDALVEIRHGHKSSWVNVNRFAGALGKPSIEPDQLVARLRIPYSEWDVQFFKKYGREYPDTDSAAMACVCRISKRTISEFRLMETGPVAIRSHDAETMLIGRKLPLSQRDIESVSAEYKAYCDSLGLDDCRVRRFLLVMGSMLSSLEHGDNG